MTPLRAQGLASCNSRRTVCISTSRPVNEPTENSASRTSTHYTASTSQSTWSLAAHNRGRRLVTTRRQVISRALFDPPPFQPEKLAVLLAAGTTALEPAPPLSRKYTLTHNDITGNLRLTIGPDYNEKQISGFYTRLLRDEVVAEWVNVGSSGFALHVYCHVSGEERWLAPPLLRNYIFRREMPLVLDTLVYADRQLLRAQPALAQAQVYVHFQSSVKELDTVEYWGVLGDRATWPKGPTSILLRMIYAVVGWPPSLSAQPADLSIDLPSELRDVEEAVRQQQQQQQLVTVWQQQQQQQQQQWLSVQWEAQRELADPEQARAVDQQQQRLPEQQLWVRGTETLSWNARQQQQAQEEEQEPQWKRAEVVLAVVAGLSPPPSHCSMSSVRLGRTEERIRSGNSRSDSSELGARGACSNSCSASVAAVVADGGGSDSGSANGNGRGGSVAFNGPAAAAASGACLATASAVQNAVQRSGKSSIPSDGRCTSGEASLGGPSNITNRAIDSSINSSGSDDGDSRRATVDPSVYPSTSYTLLPFSLSSGERTGIGGDTQGMVDDDGCADSHHDRKDGGCGGGGSAQSAVVATVVQVPALEGSGLTSPSPAPPAVVSLECGGFGSDGVGVCNGEGGCRCGMATQPGWAEGEWEVKGGAREGAEERGLLDAAAGPGLSASVSTEGFGDIMQQQQRGSSSSSGSVELRVVPSVLVQGEPGLELAGARVTAGRTSS